jgi:EmrB/QacA subfamily drug resistance transporter
LGPDRLKPFVLLTAILGTSLSYIDGTVVTVALSAIRADLDATLADMQWVINGYTLFLSALILVAGGAGDAFGHRRIFNYDIAIFALASLACGFASTPGQLIAARTIQGIGGAMMVPASLALITSNFPKSERGRAIGIWAAASGIAAALGPVLGGWIIDTASWRVIFLINLPIAAVALAVSTLWVPETVTPGATQRMDWVGAALACLGLAGIALALTDAAEGGLDQSVFWTGAIGVGLMATFLVYEGKVERPMLSLALFRSRVFSAANALTLMLYFALSGLLFFLPITLIEGHGFRAVVAGAVFLPFTVVLAALSTWSGRLTDRRGLRLPLTAGPAISGVAMLLLVPAVWSGEIWLGIVPAMVVLGAGMGLTVASLSAGVMNSVSEDNAGIASGVNNAVSRVASLFAVAALGIVVVGAFFWSLTAAVGEAGAGFAATLDELGGLAFGRTPDISGLSPGQGEAVLSTYRTAILAAFNSISLIAALFAFASAAIAWLTMPAEPDGKSATYGGVA